MVFVNRDRNAKNNLKQDGRFLVQRWTVNKGFGNANGKEVYNMNLKIMFHPVIIVTVIKSPPPTSQGIRVCYSSGNINDGVREKSS